jgi:ribosomal protein S27E
MSNIENFRVICNKCGGEDVDLSGYCGQNYGFGYLTCNDCKNEEEAEG